MVNKVITRFAPSPTGFLHIGGVRTALFNYLFTRKNKGIYYLRIDDTDKTRSKKEYEEDIVNSFKRLGLLWDNKEDLRQSERIANYKKYLEKLLAEDKAYVSKEIELKEGERSEVIRLRNPNKKVEFDDLIRGKVAFDTTELGDFVIAKSVDEPIYHFASVVDDFEMSITHVIRAEEHLSNTPRQILIQEAIGASRPLYAHLPLILSADRSKLSKRQGSVALRDFLAEGYLPDGLLNYLALLGWHPADDRELFSLSELVDNFDLNRVQKSGAIWNQEKLDWINKEHLLRIDRKLRIENYDSQIGGLGIKDYQKEILEKIEPMITERINKFGDVKGMIERGEIQYFFSQPAWRKEGFLWKGKGEFANVAGILAACNEILEKLPAENFSADKIKDLIWPYAEEKGRGNVLWPLRYALSGLEKSPDPFFIASVIGKDKTRNRLENAVAFLNA